jgi:hypothetical protein
MYKINSNGWDYTITDVDYQPEQPAVTHRLPEHCDPAESEDIQFKWTRKPDCNHSHAPEQDDEFLAELIEMVTGE